MPDYEVLPEFRVTLTRLELGEEAYPRDGSYDWLGQRTKLGGEPDWDQHDERPMCPSCEKPMSFVAQIDSVEHLSKTNPHGVDPIGPNQKWMFVDVGMIYVFYCFECLETQSVLQFG